MPWKGLTSLSLLAGLEVPEDRGSGALVDDDEGDSWPGIFFLEFCKIKTLTPRTPKALKIVLRYKQS